MFAGWTIQFQQQEHCVQVQQHTWGNWSLNLVCVVLQCWMFLHQRFRAASVLTRFDVTVLTHHILSPHTGSPLHTCVCVCVHVRVHLNTPSVLGENTLPPSPDTGSTVCVCLPACTWGSPLCLITLPWCVFCVCPCCSPFNNSIPTVVCSLCELVWVSGRPQLSAGEIPVRASAGDGQKKTKRGGSRENRTGVTQCLPKLGFMI